MFIYFCTAYDDNDDNDINANIFLYNYIASIKNENE